MNSFSPEPRWFRMLSRLVIRLGHGRATLLLTLAVWGLAMAIAHAVVAATGLGSHLIATVTTSLCALGLAPLIGSAVLRLVFELHRTRQQLAEAAMRDELTGLMNRRHFMQRAEQEWTRGRRYGTAAALLLIDADRFKRINQLHGYLAGDVLLREMAGTAQQSLRQVDMLARYGGASLVVFLPHTDPLGALDVAERIRAQSAALQLSWQGASVGTTVSVGVASLGTHQTSLDSLIQEADAALQEAKAAGRNCVRAAPLQGHAWERSLPR